MRVAERVRVVVAVALERVVERGRGEDRARPGEERDLQSHEEAAPEDDLAPERLELRGLGAARPERRAAQKRSEERAHVPLPEFCL